MPMLDTAHGRLSYLDNAPADVGAPQVLLLHSGGASHRQWRQMVGQMGARWRVLAPDMIGYGDTPMTAQAPTLADEIGLLSGLLDTLEGPVHVIGHSYGGAMALELARARPERIASLALYEPVAFAVLRDSERQDAWREIMLVAKRHMELVEQGDAEGAAHAFLDYWIVKGALRAMPAPQQQYIIGCMNKLTAEWRMMFNTNPHPNDYHALTMPVLLICSGETTLAARSVVAELRQRLPAPRYLEMPGLGHMAPIMTAEPVNAVLLDFLDSVLGDGRRPLESDQTQ